MRAIAVLMIGLSLIAGLSACNKPAGGPAGEEAMQLGNAQAKVTVHEFASLGCPICAKWNNEAFPAFKAKYIDTGKVHYTLKEFSTGDAPVAAAGFLLARCAGKDQYFKVADAVFRQEAELLESNRNADKRARLIQIAGSIGMNEQQFDACVTDDKALSALNARSDKAGQEFHIQSTPTFIINGTSMEGFQTLAQLDAAISHAQAAAQGQAAPAAPAANTAPADATPANSTPANSTPANTAPAR